MELQDRLVKSGEAAEILGFSKSWIEKRPAGIPVVRIGRSVRYRISDLLKIIEGGRHESKDQ